MKKFEAEINGELKEATVLLQFDSNVYNKEFVVYTFDEVKGINDSDKCEIFASSMFKDTLSDISKEEWEHVKDTLSKAVTIGEEK